MAEGAADAALETRLRDIPRTAHVRGIFLRILDADLARRGLTYRSSWHWEEVLGEEPRSYRLYPVRHLLTGAAKAGARVSASPSEGIRDIFRGACVAYAESWFGRSLKKLLKPDPLAALRWLEKSRDHFCDYGDWRIESVAVGEAIIHMVDEYLWIESAHRGGCEGLLRAGGVAGEVTAELDGPFTGRLHVRWQAE